MNRINGRNLATEVEWVGIGVTSTIAGIEVLVSSVQTNTHLEPISWLDVTRETSRQTVETRGLQVALLVEIA